VLVSSESTGIKTEDGVWWQVICFEYVVTSLKCERL